MIFTIYLNHLFKEKKEMFENVNGINSIYLYMRGYSSRYYYMYGVTDYIFLAVLYMTSLFISIASAYLSYTCTWKGTVSNTFVRLLTAFFAFLLGPIYLIWYFLVNYLGKMC